MQKQWVEGEIHKYMFFQFIHRLYVKNLPENVTEGEIMSAFPDCMHVCILTPKKKGSL
jgi:RNA recognition motif-containing protein